MAERRKHTRVRARGVVAHVRALDRGFSCQVENVSEGGVFLGTDQLLPGGSFVTLELVKPGLRRTLHLEGTVTAALSGGSAKRGMGIAFAEMPADSKARLLLLLHGMGAPISINLRAVQKVLSSAGSAEPTAPTREASLQEMLDSIPPPAAGAGPDVPLPAALEPVSEGDAQEADTAPLSAQLQRPRLRARIDELEAEVAALRGTLRDREAQLARLRSLGAAARERPGRGGK
ncbi:MAG TPA: PilZ domain-containing protein [Myxococcales bacterium]|nr:PilZ domain-containing protein [Myxococcales bacterium]